MRMVLFTVATVAFVSVVHADAQPRAGIQSFDSSGVRIAYVDQGQGEPVLLLHGFGANKEVWKEAVAPRLIAAGFRVIAHDARGHGNSGNPTTPEKYGQEDVNDVVRLLDHLSIPRAHIVGYSRGAWVASRFVVQQSLRVRSAVLGGWGVDDPIETMPLSDCMANADAIEQGKPMMLVARAVTPVGLPTVQPPNLSLSLSPEVRAARAASWRGLCKGPRITAAELSATGIPILAIVGELDGIMPSVRAMAPQIRALETVVIAGASHAAARANPAFIDAIEAFLKRQRSANDRRMEDLRRTMVALATARAAADGNTWSRYVTNEFVVIHPDGRIHDRAEEIAELKASKPTAVLVRSAERFHWHREHTVVYASDFISTRGQPVRAIEVWIDDGSTWKIAAAQVTRIE